MTRRLDLGSWLGHNGDVNSAPCEIRDPMVAHPVDQLSIDIREGVPVIEESDSKIAG